MNPWVELTKLDCTFDVARGLVQAHAWKRAAAVRVAADQLATHRYGSQLALVAAAPSVAAAPATWQWLVRALSGEAWADAGTHLDRLGLAAAVQCADDAAATVFSTPVSLPGTGLFIPADQDPGLLQVVRGTPRFQLQSLPRVRSLTVDAYEPLLQLPAADDFDFEHDAEAIASLVELLESAFRLADRLVPGLPARTAATIIPVVAGYHQQRSATHESVPGATYLSSSPTPIDALVALVHEEAHALLNAAEDLLGMVLPDWPAPIAVSWKPEPRPLPAVLHGIAAFSRVAEVETRGATQSPPTVRATPDPGLLTRVGEAIEEVIRRVPREVLGEEILSWLRCPPPGVDRPDKPPPGTLERLATAPNWIHIGGVPDSLVAAVLDEASTASWKRAEASWYGQYEAPLSAQQTEMIESLLAPLVVELAGRELAVTNAMMHLLTQGDRIEAHTDAERTDVQVRTIVMATPGWQPGDGGALELWANDPPQHVTALGATAGSAVALRIGDTDRHAVGAVTKGARLTAVLSWGLAP